MLARSFHRICMSHGLRVISVHLPEGWHRKSEWMALFEASTGPFTQAA